jgi:hypothetical protein
MNLNHDLDVCVIEVTLTILAMLVLVCITHNQS